MVRLRCILPLCWSLLLWTSWAFGKPSYKDLQQARQLVSEAKVLIEQGKLGEATEKLQAADRLDPKPSGKLEIAKLLIEQGRLLDAADVLDEAVQGEATVLKERKARERAQEMADELVERTPTLTVVVAEPQPEEVRITLGGKPFDPAAGPHPLDPGRYQLTATAPGYQQQTRDVFLKEKARETVSFKLLAELVDDEPIDLGPWPAIAAWSLGGAALVVGSIFGIVAIDQTNTLYEEYDCRKDTCPSEAQDDLNASLLNGDIATIAFVVAGVGLAAGTILWFVLDEDDTEDGAAARRPVTPILGPGYVGLQSTF